MCLFVIYFLSQPSLAFVPFGHCYMSKCLLLVIRGYTIYYEVDLVLKLKLKVCINITLNSKKIEGCSIYF